MIGHGYSSDVSLRLLVGDLSIALSQIGPGYINLREPIPIGVDPCDAELLVRVDGTERRVPIRLVDGVYPFDDSARTMKCVGVISVGQ